jgi:hypothetical protein
MNRLLVLVAAVVLLTFGCRDTNRDAYGENEGQYGTGETAERAEVPDDPEAAREDLEDQTQEAVQAQREAAEARAQLDALIARACSGVQQPMQTECPIEAANVRSVREIDNGVAVSLDEPANQADDLEQRMDCYLAHTVLRQSGQSPGASTSAQQPGGLEQNTREGQGTTQQRPEQAQQQRAQQQQAQQQQQRMGQPQVACIVDSPDLEVDVEESDGRLELQITTDDDAKVEQLRTRARDLASHAAR